MGKANRLICLCKVYDRYWFSASFNPISAISFAYDQGRIVFHKPHPALKVQSSMVQGTGDGLCRRQVTSLTAGRETLRGEKYEGYFNFKPLKIYVHIRIRDKSLQGTYYSCSSTSSRPCSFRIAPPSSFCYPMMQINGVI